MSLWDDIETTFEHFFEHDEAEAIAAAKVVEEVWTYFDEAIKAIEPEEWVVVRDLLEKTIAAAASGTPVAVILQQVVSTATAEEIPILKSLGADLLQALIAELAPNAQKTPLPVQEKK